MDVWKIRLFFLERKCRRNRTAREISQPLLFSTQCCHLYHLYGCIFFIDVTESVTKYTRHLFPIAIGDLVYFIRDEQICSTIIPRHPIEGDFDTVENHRKRYQNTTTNYKNLRVFLIFFQKHHVNYIQQYIIFV